jgi:very-short-patch-repair endonuclease
MPAFKKKLAKTMRKNPTQAEARLWENLRRKVLGVNFRRQAPMYGYIADFWCPSQKLVVEVDGGYHDRPAQKLYDRTRTKHLAQYGIQVLRFRNEEVLTDLPFVLRAIKTVLAGS